MMEAPNAPDTDAAAEGEGQLPNQAEKARAAKLQSQTPQAEEPLPPGIVKTFAQAVAAAAETASGGQVKLPEFPIQSTGPPMQMVPGPVYQAAESIASFIRAATPKIPALAQYAFDCDEAAKTVDGLRDATMKLKAFAADKSIAAMLSAPSATAPKGGAPSPPPAPEAKDGGVDDFVKAQPKQRKGA